MKWIAFIWCKTWRDLLVHQTQFDTIQENYNMHCCYKFFQLCFENWFVQLFAQSNIGKLFLNFFSLILKKTNISYNCPCKSLAFFVHPLLCPLALYFSPGADTPMSSEKRTCPRCHCYAPPNRCTHQLCSGSEVKQPAVGEISPIPQDPKAKLTLSSWKGEIQTYRDGVKLLPVSLPGHLGHTINAVNKSPPYDHSFRISTSHPAETGSPALHLVFILVLPGVCNFKAKNKQTKNESIKNKIFFTFFKNYYFFWLEHRIEAGSCPKVRLALSISLAI